MLLIHVNVIADVRYVMVAEYLDPPPMFVEGKQFEQDWAEIRQEIMDRTNDMADMSGMTLGLIDKGWDFHFPLSMSVGM